MLRGVSVPPHKPLLCSQSRFLDALTNRDQFKAQRTPGQIWKGGEFRAEEIYMIHFRPGTIYLFFCQLFSFTSASPVPYLQMLSRCGFPGKEVLPFHPQLFLPPGISPALSGFHVPCLHFSGTQMTRIANTIPKGTLPEICGTA